MWLCIGLYSSVVRLHLSLCLYCKIPSSSKILNWMKVIDFNKFTIKIERVYAGLQSATQVLEKLGEDGGRWEPCDHKRLLEGNEMPLQDGKKEGLPSEGQCELWVKEMGMSFKNQGHMLETVCVSWKWWVDIEDSLQSLQLGQEPYSLASLMTQFTYSI